MTGKSVKTKSPSALSSGQTMDDVNLQLFEGLFPKEYLENMVLTETNQHLNDPLSYGELLHWIGLWVLMSTVHGSD